MATETRPEIINIDCFEVPNYTFYLKDGDGSDLNAVIYNPGDYVIYTQPWSKTASYNRDEYVRYKDCIYKSIINYNLGNEPNESSSSTSWEKWTLEREDTFRWGNNGNIYYENMYKCTNTFEITEWDSEGKYYYGAIVYYAGIYYKYISTESSNERKTPDIYSTHWEQIKNGTALDTWDEIYWEKVNPIKVKYLINGLTNSLGSKVTSMICCDDALKSTSVFTQNSLPTDELGTITITRESIKKMRNGVSYKVYLGVLDNGKLITDWSRYSYFNTYNIPLLEFVGEYNVPADGYYSLESGSMSPILKYTKKRPEDKIPKITAYRIDLYDKTHQLINTSGIQYVDSTIDVLALTYKFDGFSISEDRDEIYYIKAEAYNDDTLTTNGTGMTIKSNELKVVSRSGEGKTVGLEVSSDNGDTGIVTYLTKMMVILPKEYLTPDNPEGLFDYEYIETEDPSIQEFDPNITYQIGELVTYNDQVYQFRNVHNGAWDENDVLKYDRNANICYIDLLNKNDKGLTYIATYDKGWSAETNNGLTFSISMKNIRYNEELIYIKKKNDNNNVIYLSTVSDGLNSYRFKLRIDGLLGDLVLYSDSFTVNDPDNNIYTVWIYKDEKGYYDLALNIYEYSETNEEEIQL